MGTHSIAPKAALLASGCAALIALLPASPAKAQDSGSDPAADQPPGAGDTRTGTERSLRVPPPPPQPSPPAAATPPATRSTDEPAGGRVGPSPPPSDTPSAPVAADSPAGDDDGGVPLALVLVAAFAVLGLTAAAVIVVRHNPHWFRHHRA